MKLLEIKGPDSLASNKIKRFANILKRDCMPFLQQIDFKVAKYPMFRGINVNTKIKRTLIQKNVRLTGRKPVDTSESSHKLLNNFFIEKFGAPFRDALFVSGNINLAKDYGNTVLVFPINRFKFIWSPRILDIWMDIITFAENAKADSEKHSYQFNMEHFIMDRLGKAEFTDKNIKNAILMGNEIMIRVPKYHAIHFMEKEYSFIKHDGITPEELQQLQEELLK